MSEEFSRTELLIGEKAVAKLKNSKVAVFGAGGVGGYAIEALIRCGIGEIDLIDNDTINPSNINRQIIATRKTLGQYKVEAFKTRIQEINPNTKVNVHKIFYSKETESEIDFNKFDYVIDAIDTVASKILIIENAKLHNTPVISSMGTGNKLNPAGFIVDDISKTSVCPLARVIRYELKKRGIKDVKVVYSKEQPLISKVKNEEYDKKTPVGSISFVPPAAGLIMAGEVVKDLISGI